MTPLTVPLHYLKQVLNIHEFQLHKLLLSALKSEGSPTQQMGRRCPERKLTEREREKKREHVWLIFIGGRQTTFPLFILPLQRGLQEALAQANMLVHTLNCASELTACVCSSCTCMLLFLYLNIDVLECLYASAFVSVCPYYFASSSGRLPGNCGRQLSTRPGGHGADASACLWFW